MAGETRDADHSQAISGAIEDDGDLAAIVAEPERGMCGWWRDLEEAICTQSGPMTFDLACASISGQKINEGTRWILLFSQELVQSHVQASMPVPKVSS